jgi:hypothetical protein
MSIWTPDETGFAEDFDDNPSICPATGDVCDDPECQEFCKMTVPREMD